MRSFNKFYDNISITKGLSSGDMFKFFGIVESQGQSKCVTEKNISDGKEMTKNINYRSKAEFSSFEGRRNMYRIASNQLHQLLFLRLQI